MRSLEQIVRSNAEADAAYTIGTLRSRVAALEGAIERAMTDIRNGNASTAGFALEFALKQPLDPNQRKAEAVPA